MQIHIMLYISFCISHMQFLGSSNRESVTSKCVLLNLYLHYFASSNVWCFVLMFIKLALLRIGKKIPIFQPNAVGIMGDLNLSEKAPLSDLVRNELIRRFEVSITKHFQAAWNKSNLVSTTINDLSNPSTRNQETTISDAIIEVLSYAYLNTLLLCQNFTCLPDLINLFRPFCIFLLLYFYSHILLRVFFYLYSLFHLHVIYNEK